MNEPIPETARHVDLLIQGDDVSLDQAGTPRYCWDRDSIGQDLKHAIRESGYLVSLIGERDRERRQLQLQRIRILVESDRRIVPGTVDVELVTHRFERNTGIWLLSADTYEFGPVQYNIASVTGSP